MAGERIFMRTDLARDPRVQRIKGRLAVPNVLTVVGALWWLWAHADSHTEDGLLRFESPEMIDEQVGLPGFAVELVGVGWLEVLEVGVRIPRFEEYNGKTAKRRLHDAQRKYAARNADTLRTSCGHSADIREDKTRTTGGPESESGTGTGKKKKLPSAPKPVRSVASAAFAEFWAAYPRKLDKQDAERAWQKQGLDALLPDILAALAAFKRCEQWRRDAGQFIPHAATWLNRRQWEDEHPESGGIDPGSMESAVEIKGNW